MGKHAKVLSYGGGVQTVALCVLAKEGVLERPDLIAIADTGREVQTTWDYLRDVMTPYLAPMGLTVEIVPHTLAGRDLYGPDGITLMPAHTRNIVGEDFWGQPVPEDGRLPSYCAGTWKRDVMEKWYRLVGLDTVEQWIGYSMDERQRVGKDHRKWCKNRFPLIELGITDTVALGIIKNAGLPRPHKSRCWMCPHQRPEQWREVKARADEWRAAMALERAINETKPEGSGEFYLYSGRVPLPLANFDKDAGLAPPPRHCETAGCWT